MEEHTRPLTLGDAIRLVERDAKVNTKHASDLASQLQDLLRLAQALRKAHGDIRG